MKIFFWKAASYGALISVHLGGVIFSLWAIYCFWDEKIKFLKFTWYDLLFFPAVYMLGMLFGGMFIWKCVSFIILKNNGYPFKIGDRVEILRGEHKNRQGLIYELWDVRNEVRVDLGSNCRDRVKDVFRYYWVRKTN